MPLDTRLLMFLSIVAAAACGGHTSPVAPAAVQPSPVTPAPDAAITISSFRVRVTPGPIGDVVYGLFTLTETSGLAGAMLQVVQFEAGGAIDVQDSGCWGDAIRIPAGGSFDATTLGYCAPQVFTKVPGDAAALAVTYQNANGQRVTIRATTEIPR